MNVLVVIFERLLPISGGGTPRFRKLIDVLIERGHEVTVAAAFNIDIKDAQNILKCDGVLQLKDARFEKNKISKYLIYTPLNISNVIKGVMRIKPNLIIANNSLAGFSNLLAKKITGCLSIINVGDLLFEYLPFYLESDLWAKQLTKIGRMFEKKVLSESDKIIAISKYMKHVLIQKGIEKEKIDVIYDGVDIDLFNPKIKEAEKLREKYAAGAEKVVMFHGVFSPQDRPEIIANAAERILKKHPKTIFWLVGDGDAVPNIKKIITTSGIEEHFFFSGWIPHEEVPSYISACDVGLVILPNDISAKTKVTLKTFEYWSCEKPIVISDLYAPREVVSPSKTGLFYKPENPEDLSEKICFLLENKDFCMEMGRAGRQIVEKNYNWRLLATKFVKTCEDLYDARSNKFIS